MAVLSTRVPEKARKRLYRAEGGDSQSGPFPKYSAAFDCFRCRCSQYLERVTHPMSRRTLLHWIFFEFQSLLSVVSSISPQPQSRKSTTRRKLSARIRSLPMLITNRTQCVVSPRARDSGKEFGGVATARVRGQDAEA